MASKATMSRYERKDENGAWSVHAAKTGWIVEVSSRWQGAVNGQRLLISYRASGYSPDTDLAGEINETGTIAADAIRHEAEDRLAELARGAADRNGVRVLRRGHVVR